MLLLIVFFTTFLTVFTQQSPSAWIWISGSKVTNQPGNYGAIASSSNIPSARVGSMYWRDSNDNLWLFGGWGISETSILGSFNDLWKFDGTYWTWISGSDTIDQLADYGSRGIASSTNIPSARRVGVSWIDSNNTLWLFGGATENSIGHLNDLWKFDGTFWTWISGSNVANQLGNYGTQGIASSSNIPGGRYSVSFWIDSNNNLWLFGGVGYAATGLGWLSDLWRFNGVNWIWISGSNLVNQNGNYGSKEIASLSNAPGARYNAMSWKDSNNNLWLFGGIGYPATGSSGDLNDLWKFNGVNWTWISGSNLINQRGNYGTKGIASSSNIPGARGAASSWIDSNNTLWLFGGWGQGASGSWGFLNDLWKFDGTNWIWISGSNLVNQTGKYGGLIGSSNVPGGRWPAASWIDSKNNLWLFGGLVLYDRYYFFNDLWKFSFSSFTASSVIVPRRTRLTTSPITTSPLTTSPFTTSQLTTSRLTTSPITTRPVTTSPFTTNRITTAPVQLTTSPVIQLTSSPVTSAEVTTREITTSPLSTGEITSAQFTSGDFTTNSISTQEITSNELTTSPITSESLTSGNYGTSSVIVPVSSSTSSSNQVVSSSGIYVTGNNSLSSMGIGLIVASIIVVLLIVGIVGLIFFVKRKRNSKDLELSSSEIPLDETKSNYHPLPFGLRNSSLNESQRKLETGLNFLIQYSELEMGNKVGSGAFGEVYAAVWRGTKVAVKVLKGVSMSDFGDFEAEAKIMTKLRPHPNVVLFLGICSEPLCIVVAFCEGGSLYSLLKSTLPISKNAIERIVRGIVAGMLHLHSENIIHRDLAARNVLLGESNEAKVSDFGLARVASRKEDQNQTLSQSGPLKHMAPECLNARQYSEKSDVWAFGVTLYEIFEREDPYPNLSLVETAIAVTQTSNPLRLTASNRMSNEMKKLFNSLFATNPNDRPNFESIMKQLNGMSSLF